MARVKVLEIKKGIKHGWRIVLITGIVAALFPLIATAQTDSTAESKKHSAKTHATSAASGKKTASASHAHVSATRTGAHTSKTKHSHSRKPLTTHQLARSRQFHQAFVASSQLRPMAQQLASMHSPAAYAGVSAYAHSHTGEAAAAAYIALGHAYLLDHKFPEAIGAFHSADEAGKSLDDYADYLTAQTYLQSGKLAEAEPVLSAFVQKHPDSIFVHSIPVLEANLFLQENDPQAALRTLDTHRGETIANRADFQFALAKANLMAGRVTEAQQLFRRVYLNFPLSTEASQARVQLVSSGEIASLSPEERRHHADALYAANRYSDAEEEYRS
ncbi:MAG TPA: tetratricopeptide repeat protein, partial [Silvibacterium sp.]|nr:tetratricopeptide repeat protein [Silvibacterium sp.]